MIGSTRQIWLTPEPPEEQIVGRLLEARDRARARIAEADVQSSWWGLRPLTPDERPLVGAVREGLHVATGHGSEGVILGAGTAQLVAAQIAGEQPPFDARPTTRCASTTPAEPPADRGLGAITRERRRYDSGPTCHGHPHPRGLLPSRTDRAAGTARVRRRRPRQGLPRVAADLDGIDGAVILSTCNRVEVYGDVSSYHAGFLALKRLLTETRGIAAEELADPLYAHWERDAADHLFAVASGLDSMVLGETQIHAQVRDALRRAEAEDASTSPLTALFHSAARAGRRVRQETSLGAAPDAFVATRRRPRR